MEQKTNRLPALTLLALAAVIAAFTIPAYAPLFWILAGILSFSAAMLAYRTRPEFSEPRTAFLSLVFTVVGVVIGIILLQLL